MTWIPGDAELERRALGNTGLHVSVLGFGGAPAAYLNFDPAQTARMVESLLDAGVNLIDTAANYPGSEEFIGECLCHRRDEFVLVSKCGWKSPDLQGESFSAKLIGQTVDRSLAMLGTDRIDVMLLHSCDLETLQQGEALGALVEARKAGKIRFAGYSGDNDAAAHAATLADVAVIQTSISIADQHNIDLVLPAARRNGKGVIAKRPIANAAWKQLHEQPGMYQTYARTYTERLAAMKLDPGELGIDGAPESAWPELALRFTLSQDGVHTAIIGTTSAANTRMNLAAAAKGPLPTEAVASIRAAFKRADPQGKWLGET
jgi:aryl-alcohol dehydrogenase-like predicted oxidoreductase